ncbi:MAG: ATP-dependent DNA helicase RecG [Gemmatimonadaceae bacterium]|nr:ATP-dependent DNA helicase RecG [Gemmatimonadaceae bacterium]
MSGDATARRDKRGGGVAPPVTLLTPVTYLKGVGPRRAELLAKLGITTAGDLLMHVPRRYEDATTVLPVARAQPGQDVTVLGRVISKGVIPTRRGLRIFQAVIQDASGLLEVGWPGQPHLDRTINVGDVLLLSGPVRIFHGRQLAPREFVNLGADDTGTAGGRVLAVYPATDGLPTKLLRQLVDAQLDALLPQITDPLPASVLAAAGVPPLADALRLVHRPGSVKEAERGRARLAFEELFCVQLLHRRANQLERSERDGITFVNRRKLTTALKELLPFTLTGAQVRVLREIVADMTSHHRMHRLLQGDVGSGKTIVALFAALVAMENDWQAALMAPTELLAEQHVRTFTTLLAPLGIAPALLTGRMGAAQRRAATARLASCEPLIVVGTHALVQDATSFGKLGLVIVDEQHRFGVEQRKALQAKGATPDVLLMSATPIPRSLALTIYGDLDVSLLDEKPPGRVPIVTTKRPELARDRVMTFVNAQLDVGRQAYVVYPVIEESERSDLRAATQMAEELAGGVFAGRRVGLLHGRLKGDEKDAVMRAFLAREIDVLVATTVIEVGIDVPNASVMLIEHPERFGLSQLHQLRGRVGRGADDSYCILLGDVSPDSAERLDIFVSTEDGFAIARSDMRLRGMGDLFGERQSGMPSFRVADPLRDEAMIPVARAAAEALLSRDPALVAPEHQPLRELLTGRYRRALELFRVG